MFYPEDDALFVHREWCLLGGEAGGVFCRFVCDFVGKGIAEGENVRFPCVSFDVMKCRWGLPQYSAWKAPPGAGYDGAGALPEAL